MTGGFVPAATEHVSVAARETRSPAVPAWGPGGEFTVGAEDEVLLVDHRGHLLGNAAGPALASVHEGVPAEGAIVGEIFVDEVELQTPVCADAEELMNALAALRRSLARGGTRPMAVGVHPTAELGDAVIAASPRYDRLGAEFAGLLRTPTAAFQVHVGLPDVDSAMLVYRALRNRLPIFRALAAGSPYWHGRDSGLACARAAIIRSYPRTTMPPALPGWQAYVDTIERQMWASEVPDYTYVCWELRPQPRLGTVELRVMDAQPCLAHAAGLAALAQGVARHAVESPDRGDLPDDIVLANDFAACRLGLDATIVDPVGSRRPLLEVAAAALEDARRALAPESTDGPLEVVRALLVEPPEYARQRAMCEQQGMPALLADLVARTMDVGR
jgi:carboxylate-amine ligase